MDFNQVRSLLASRLQTADASDDGRAGHGTNVLGDWHTLWSAVANHLLVHLEGGNEPEFESLFRVVAETLRVCEPVGRQVAVAALFGDFTRRTIACGFDRTRFVEWFGPAELFEARSGRLRGRVLYFNNAEGHGKVLGADRIVYFVHFGMIRMAGFRSVDAGQLVEFTPELLVINGQERPAATSLVPLTEIARKKSAEDVG